MVILNVYRSIDKSKKYGKTVYLDGLAVFKHQNGAIVLTYHTEKKDKKTGKPIGDICYIERGTDADHFFRDMLKSKLR